MSATTPALLAAAAGVGFGHAILPDHWVPLAVLGRTRRLPLARVARLSGLAGIAHVLVSVLLGGAIVAVGLQFRSAVQNAQDTIVGSLLLATGVGFAIAELAGRGHGHDHQAAEGQPRGHTHPRAPRDSHPHQPTHQHAPAREHDDKHTPDAPSAAQRLAPQHRRGLHGVAAVMVPFGAAASPDLTILPVFLAATTVGVATAIGSLVIFAAVTIATIVGLTLAACFGGYQVRAAWLERWGNACTALALLAIGALVLAEII
jgi:ABC-type nickel/cobalt efflux system permease component RcnA